MKSIMQKEDSGCYICTSYQGLQNHHCIGGSGRRKLCDKYGLTVKICFNHHGGDQDIHTQRLDLLDVIRKKAQEKFEETHSREEFIKVFGRNFL